MSNIDNQQCLFNYTFVSILIFTFDFTLNTLFLIVYKTTIIKINNNAITNKLTCRLNLKFNLPFKLIGLYGLEIMKRGQEVKKTSWLFGMLLY